MNTELIVSKYLAAWNETDPARRRAAIDTLCTTSCHYADPLAVADGPEALDGLIAGIQKRLPGFTFTLAGKVDAHHDQARFTWHASPAGATGEPVVIGFDVMLLEGERIRSVLGFLDKVPGG